MTCYEMVPHRHYMSVTSLTCVAIALAACGCNTSRYGLTYDSRRAQIKQVAVYPAGVQVASLHTGGVEEGRPDLEPDVRTRTVAAIREILADRGVKVTVVEPASPELETSKDTESRALMQAITDAIFTHHYLVGRSQVFDYPTGSAATDLCQENADAVLYFELKGAVPTAGRSFLAGTAAVVGIVLALVPIPVKTNEAIIQLTLIDRESGDVLWFNQHQSGTDVRSERRLRDFIRRACSYMLKPRK